MLSMEIPKEIIEGAFAAAKDSPSNSDLDEPLVSLNKFATLDILNLAKDVRKIDQEIHSLIMQILRQLNSKDEKVITDLATILNSTGECLSNSVSKGDIKALLIFLSINCYLKIDVSRFLLHLDLLHKNRTPLAEKILNL